MKAIILAENDNQALRPLNGSKPSALIRINGIPLLDHQIRGYVDAGIAEASISVISGYQHAAVQRFLTLSYPAIRCVKNPDYHLHNAARSLQLALQSSANDGDGLLVSSGDCIYDAHVIGMFAQSRMNIAAGDTGRSDGDVICVRDGRVVRADTKSVNDRDSASSADLWAFTDSAVSALSRVIAERADDTDVSMATVLNDLVRTVRVTLADVAGVNWAAIRSMDALHDADILFSHLPLSDTLCFVLDLDGTVYVGERPVDGTVAFIEHNARNHAFYFVSNNTSKLPEDYRVKLNAMGILTDSDHIITPLAPLIAYLESYDIRSAYVLGNARLLSYLWQALPDIQLTEDPDACEALVVAYDTELTYEKLRNAAIILQQNPSVLFLATHSDLVCPTERGFVPDCGCILTVLEQTTGRRPEVIFGKPSPRLVERVTRQYGAGHIAIVGDRLYTDGKMARNVGCSFICVLSGETTREQIDALDEDAFPALIVRDLGDLLS